MVAFARGPTRALLAVAASVVLPGCGAMTGLLDDTYEPLVEGGTVDATLDPRDSGPATIDGAVRDAPGPLDSGPRDATSGDEGADAASAAGDSSAGDGDAGLGDAGPGDGGAGDAAPSGSSPPSCAAGGPGMTNCGPGGIGGESCCTSLEVQGGTFYRSYDDVTYTDMSHPASVTGLALDKYEVTVGRFRQFVAAVVGGWLPSPGSGKHAHLNGGSGLNATGGGFETGWDATDWDALLATTSSGWNTNLSCEDIPTWTPSPAADENLPISCVAWQEAYAFCIWDGAFLPSEAEWNYAAAGGGGPAGQRAYPWSIPSTSTTIDCSHANYVGPGCSGGFANNVGSESPLGDGKYGQTDLAGNLFEWTLDWSRNPYVAGSCIDCAYLTPTSGRAVRGGAFWDGAIYALVSERDVVFPPTDRSDGLGVRCARTP